MNEAVPAADRREAATLVLALAIGVAGLASAVVGRGRAGMAWITVGAWSASLLAFAWPAVRPRLIVAPLSAGAAVVLAVALSAGVATTWLALPLAVAAWTAVAVAAQVRWTTILGCAVGALATAGIVLSLGADRASDELAAAAYGLACLACSTAVASRATPTTRPGGRIR